MRLLHNSNMIPRQSILTFFNHMSNHEMLQYCYRISQYDRQMQIPLRLRRINILTHSGLKLTRACTGLISNVRHY